jgi:hypothetical protein
LLGGSPAPAPTAAVAPAPPASAPAPAPPAPSGDTMLSKQATTAPIAFTGLFFSTFFGGNSAQYATPRDQYVWFKDFGIAIVG